VIASLIPPNAFLTNVAPYILWPRGDEADAAFLLGVLCSRPLDWYARRFVEIHLNYQVFNPLPIPRPARTNPLWKRTVELAGRLACPDKRFQDFADAIGVKCGKVAPDEKEEMIVELDAVVALQYGLSEEKLTHVFETFHEGWPWHEPLRRTIEHYRRVASRLKLVTAASAADDPDRCPWCGQDHRPHCGSDPSVVPICGRCSRRHHPTCVGPA